MYFISKFKLYIFPYVKKNTNRHTTKKGVWRSYDILLILYNNVYHLELNRKACVYLPSSKIVWYCILLVRHVCYPIIRIDVVYSE